MDSSTTTTVWSTTLLGMDTFVAEFAPSLEPPLKVFRTCLPPIMIFGLGIVVWWRSRHDRGRAWCRVEVAVEMVRCRCPPIWDLPTDASTQPTPYTLLCVLGYLTATLLVLDVQTLTLLLPLALTGACNLRFSIPKPTDNESEPVIPEAPFKTTSGKLPPIHPTSVIVSQSWIRTTP